MKKLCALLTLVLLFTGCQTEKKQDVVDALADGVLTVGLDDTFAPMGFRDDNNELVGFDIDLAKAVGEKLGKQEAKDWNLKHGLSIAAEGIQEIVDGKEAIEKLAKKYLIPSRNAFYIGRGIDHAVSLEGALKLKEVSYIQTEGFAAAELKHGTISLIEDGTPVIALINDPVTADLTRGNIQEVASRGANVITIVGKQFAKEGDTIVLPEIDYYLSALVSVVPAQLLAYYASKDKGLDVDKPRNLAKSVTVE